MASTDLGYGQETLCSCGAAARGPFLKRDNLILRLELRLPTRMAGPVVTPHVQKAVHSQMPTRRNDSKETPVLLKRRFLRQLYNMVSLYKGHN